MSCPVSVRKYLWVQVICRDALFSAVHGCVLFLAFQWESWRMFSWERPQGSTCAHVTDNIYIYIYIKYCPNKTHLSAHCSAPKVCWNTIHGDFFFFFFVRIKMSKDQSKSLQRTSLWTLCSLWRDLVGCGRIYTVTRFFNKIKGEKKGNEHIVTSSI